MCWCVEDEFGEFGGTRRGDKEGDKEGYKEGEGQGDGWMCLLISC